MQNPDLELEDSESGSPVPEDIVADKLDTAIAAVPEDSISPWHATSEPADSGTSLNMVTEVLQRLWEHRIHDCSDEESDTADLPNEIAGTPSLAEDDQVWLDEHEKLDEDGLYAYQRLGEAFEKELASNGESKCYLPCGKQLRSYVVNSQLTSEDKRILRLFALKARAQLTHEAFEMLPFACSGDDGEPAVNLNISFDKIELCTAFLSGLKPQRYDCCPNSCCCYVGPHADCQNCPL